MHRPAVRSAASLPLAFTPQHPLAALPIFLLQAALATDEASALMLAQLGSVGRGAGLKGFEQLKAVLLTGEEFSVENDCMTPTFKLKRAPLLKRYQGEVDAMYAAIARNSGGPAIL